MRRFLRGFRSAGVFLGKALVTVVVIALVLFGIAVAALETGWGKNRLRGLIVRQANQYLTATLEISSLGGSLFRGLELGGVRLARDGQPIVTIDRIQVSYSIRELWQNGTVIRRLVLTHPTFIVAREVDGRWNLAALIKREARQQERTGPNRPIHIREVEIVDGTVTLKDPLDFGAAHVPGRFNDLNLSFAFDYVPVTWRLTFAHASWTAPPPDLTVNELRGVIERSPKGWAFGDLSVRTPRTAFTLTGRVDRGAPTVLDLNVKAARFDFQEWGNVLRGLRNIAVTADFETRLTGPVTRLQSDLRLAGTGGSIAGRFVLDTAVPGWHGAGAVDVARIDLARWLNRPNRPSDISGHLSFDLDLDLGRHFPRGSYTFTGPHARFMEYEGRDVRARGTLTARDALVAKATAVAYGAAVSIDAGSIGLDDPFPFTFQGTMSRLDLRGVPASIPVPRVDSNLAFAYDVSGQFTKPFIAGRAVFDQSEFLGATIGSGTVGMIDTSAQPLTFSGEGDVDGVDLDRFGEGLDVTWMRDPRYRGTVSGRFHVEGSTGGSDTLKLTGGGRVTRANLFGGRVADADVTIDIREGTLATTFNGRFASIDPALALDDRRFSASTAGSANVRVTVRELLERTPALRDYDIEGTIDLGPSVLRGIPIESARLDGSLRDGVVKLSRADLAGRAVEAHGSGILTVDERPSDFQYNIVRADLAGLEALTGRPLEGQFSTTGRATGPWSALRFEGMGGMSALKSAGVDALGVTGAYGVTVPSGELARADAKVDGETTFLTLFGQTVQQASGTLTLHDDDLGFDLRVTQRTGRSGTIAGAAVLGADRQRAEISRLDIGLGSSPWRLASADRRPTLAWNNDEVTVSPVVFLGGPAGDERLGVAGTWRPDGGGALRVTAERVRLESLAGAFEPPARYSGVLDLEATLAGTRNEPTVRGRLTVTTGRIRAFSYEKLAGRIDYDDGIFDVDVRMDQSPGVWLTAVGTVPYALADRQSPERPINVVIKSSPIGLGLIEGLTDVVSNVTGQMQLDVRAIGTSRDPHFAGTVNLADAAFLVTATGVRYKNGRAVFEMARERVTVQTFHIEDPNGRALQVSGSLGTHELAVADVQIDVNSQRFEIVRNQYGRLTIDSAVKVRGRFEAPRITGDVTIEGGELRVDEILNRALFQPYRTEAVSLADVDAVAALNPWQRLGLDLSLHVPKNLRLVGDDVQVSPGTPIGLGNINLRVGGDLYFYKDPGQPLYVTGSLDSVAGTYSFQGRRFDVDEAGSSINFRGDLAPELYVSVTRLISGVQTRVTLVGDLSNPELRLTSSPPLDPSDILSLIVFNTSANQLSSSQQQELAIRAGTLAASFLAAPIVSALQNRLGLETLEIDQGDLRGGPRVAIGSELAPGLVARFSRQFGPEAYDEAQIEYYLSRILRLRATFSDAASLNSRSPFRRVERAGIDLLIFFSF